MTDERSYEGGELELFQAALNWKQYLRRQISEFLRGEVLEVGAGIGATTLALHDASVAGWTCLEPDPVLVARLEPAVSGQLDRQGRCPTLVTGTLRSLEPDRCFDTIVYIDVLEHIEHDREELELAANLLNPRGHLVVLSPAHQFLYTPFDRAIGHFRRYDRRSLVACTPPECALVRLRYLDSVGVAASLANRLMLRQSMPNAGQIVLWDRFMVPTSRAIDRLFGYTLGKSILAVWQKSG